MNISDLNNKIYGYSSLKQGEHANSILETIEQQEMLEVNLDEYNNNDVFNNINKEIKF